MGEEESGSFKFNLMVMLVSVGLDFKMGLVHLGWVQLSVLNINYSNIHPYFIQFLIDFDTIFANESLISSSFK